MKRRSFSHGGCLQLREFIQISNCCTLKLSNNTWWITFAPTVLNLYPSHFLELFHLGVPKKLEMVFITFIRTCAEKLIVFFFVFFWTITKTQLPFPHWVFLFLKVIRYLFIFFNRTK